MSPNKSKFSLVLISVVSLALLAVMVFGIYDIRNKNKQISLLLNETSQINEVGTLAQSIKAIQNNNKDNIEALDKLIFTSDKIVPLIESIEKTGRKLGLEVKIVSVEKKDGENISTPGQISIILESTDSWASISSFLQAIERLPYRVMIRESSLLKTEDDWHLRMVVTISSFD